MAEPVSDVSQPGAIDTLSAEYSWIRTDLSNLRTLLSWARTAVSLIGFGFTIYNFYDGVFSDIGGGERSHLAARNLGVALVLTGTLAMLIGAWNYWTINQFLKSSPVAMHVSRGLKLRWTYSYVLSAVMTFIGIITLLFMVRVI